MTQRLLGVGDVALLLGVQPSAVSNWRKRGTGPELPEPFAHAPSSRRGGTSPLWTAEQLAPVAAKARGELQQRLDGMDRAARVLLDNGESIA